MKLGAGVPEPFVLFDGTFSSPRLDHAECVVAGSGGDLWCGGEGGQIYRINGHDIEQRASTGGFILGLAFDGQKTLYACDLAAACVWALDTESGALDVFADGVPGHRIIAPNFPLLLPDGSLLVSDSGNAHEPRAGILRFDASGTGEVWHDQPLDFANGLARSRDGSVLFVVESWASRILAIDLDEHHRPAGPFRPHVDLPGCIPDGIAVGPDDALYVGCYEPSAVLRVPGPGDVELVAHDTFAHTLCHPTNVTFRGRLLIAANLGRWHLTGIDIGAHVGDLSDSDD